ncbi:short-chain dehydrogenase [Algibacter amylolyticus]|uniref:Short-chain dehydrogenase n=1 Tax=Algibacter amylolyticus TaxID=1608400 RepID=A0A5M7B229_9FLAO|nr:VTT domain-containing protein [Algibacter amylolyticus]KAA5821375.1 short-chain dehydrogenase [Algibacter amylolyticus]MBB5268243.1 membrane protein YqaA with SNARE-associated domain [Algibacter amylolyticus]TSJ72887.1 short-chain dehydrogenase [Algibacter amylolyticus]
MKPEPKDKTQKSRLQLLHQYYKYTGFYTFVWDAVKKSFPYIVVIVIAIYALNHFFDINEALVRLTEILPAYGVLSFFFVSETLLGLVPPEIFIAWAGKMYSPWLYLSLLAIFSYSGGLVSYWMGRSITKMPSVHNYLETKLEKQLKNSKKWGGFLIMVGAVLPLPFSIACLAAGIIEFPFRNVMMYGALRFVRFAIYGLIIFNVF